MPETDGAAQLNPLLPDAELKWLPELTPKEKVVEAIDKIQRRHFTPNKDTQVVVDKFWSMMLDDLKVYDRQLRDTKPFEHSCYRCCSQRCIKQWDRSFWEFKVVGFRKRTYVSQYKFPVKLVSVVLVFVAGMFRLIRANQDGKASFYANIIHILTNATVTVIFWLDGERVMLLPKMGAIVVSMAILYGILQHAADEGVGL